MRVFVVAPTPMMQAGLHALLTANDIQVVGTSAVPDAFSEIATDIDALVVADELQLEEVGRALAHTRTVALVVLTNNEGRVLPYLRGLELRGWGMVPLDVPAQQLQAAVVAATQGLITLPREQALHYYDRRPVAETLAIEEADETLTTREREVLDLVGQGLSNKLIARQLQISEHTVKFHVSSISNKLGAASRTDAVRRGLRQGLITL
ncbi:MAG TPA: response regulator transcription factor [Ktedonobacteraceae bacterium]|nr:response regulator transcription factor [Ktedonobacteraceae bacterium]HEV2659682.1 response regulator transcription factor [Ktedonobacteraceae bacterium]